MERPVELVPLTCPKCETPVPARPDEVAWVCGRCGQGLLLDESRGLVEQQVHYQAGIPQGAKGKPFWAVEAQVQVERQMYSGNQSTQAQQFWSQRRRFLIPAFTCPLETLLMSGPQLLLQPPALQDGPVAAFEPVILSPHDIQPVVEFIVVAVEAARKDQLKQIQVMATLSEPVLWILP